MATTTRHSTPSGPTGISGQSYRLRTIWLCCPLLELVGRQVQTCLDQRMIKHAVFFATSHKREACHIREYSPRAILPVEPEQGTALWELVCREVARDRGESLAQFRSVATVPSVAKTAEPLEAVRLADDCPSSYDLPPLA